MNGWKRMALVSEWIYNGNPKAKTAKWGEENVDIVISNH